MLKTSKLRIEKSQQLALSFEEYYLSLNGSLSQNQSDNACKLKKL